MVTGLRVNLRQIWTITAIHEEDFAASSLATTIQTSKARLRKNCVV